MSEDEYLLRRLAILENLVGALGSVLAARHPELFGTVNALDNVWKEAIDQLNKEQLK